ncbi:MAG: hypothetical protein C0412_21665, partial [Flavobacterium sp.]|nr:hypothetical protein [Flavobacterium sp.]
QLDIGKNPATANYSNSSSVTFVRLTFRVISTGGGPTGTDNLTTDYDVTPGTSGVFLSGSKITPMSIANQIVSLAEDNTAPVINNCSPILGAINVPANTSVACDVTDGETGIYLADTTITVNGVTYTNSVAPTYSTSAITNGYRITATPASVLPYLTVITVSGTAKDNAYDNGPVLARNTGTLAPYTFTTEDDLTAPAISSLNPASGATGVSVSTNITFHIKDLMPGSYNGMGVDIDTLQITVNATGWGTTVYTKTGANTFSYTGDQFDYAITINPATDFLQNTLVGVQVQADDIHIPGNNLTTSYSFTTSDTNPPICDTFIPSKGSTTMTVSDNISFHCKDTGVGVNIDQVNTVVDGVTYTKTGTSTFSYSGDSSDYLITVNPTNDFAGQYASEVIINAKDISGNTLNQISYGLATGVGTTTCSTCPTCPTCSTCSCGGGGNYYPSYPSYFCPAAKTEYVNNYNETMKYVQIPFITTEEEMEKVSLLKINEKFVSGEDIVTLLVDEIKENIVFVGTADPFMFTSLLIESDPFIITTIADKNGKWQISIPYSLFSKNAKHNIYAIARNAETKEITGKRLLAQIDFIQTPLFDVSTQPATQVAQSFDYKSLLYILIIFITGGAVTLLIQKLIKKIKV